MNDGQQSGLRHRSKNDADVDAVSSVNNKTNDAATTVPLPPPLSNLNHITSNNGLPAVHNYGSASEYAEAVRTWLWAYHNWQLSQCLMPFMLQQHHQLQCQQQLISAAPTNQTQGSTATPAVTSLQVASATSSARGVQYTIPHFGRRVLAEVTDGLLCFMFSLMFTFILVEIGIIDLDKYEKLLNYEADLKVVIDITQDLFPLEVLKRLITSFVEALYLSYGVGTIPRGQTPGKYLLGLKVIPCEHIDFVSVRDGIVSVSSSTQRIPFKGAVARSIIKNFALGFLFPLCVVMFTFRFNRAIYDLASDTVVVEAT